MAAWFDLSKRLDAGLGADDRLHVESIYRGEGLPGWLSTPWAAAQHAAGDKLPILALNVKNVKTADTLCLVRLADLERLVEGDPMHAREPHGSTGPAGTP